MSICPACGVGAENIHHEECPVGLSGAGGAPSGVSTLIAALQDNAELNDAERQRLEAAAWLRCQAERIAELEKTIRALCDARPQVIGFALQIEAVFAQREALGRRDSSGMPFGYLLQQLRLETYQLQEQCDLIDLESQVADPERVCDHAVNVALHALWIAIGAGAVL